MLYFKQIIGKIVEVQAVLVVPQAYHQVQVVVQVRALPRLPQVAPVRYICIRK